MPITITSPETSTNTFFGGGPGLPPVILDHPTQSSTPIDGWKSVLLGFPFLLFGLFIEGVAFGFVPVRGKHESAWMISLVGAFIAFAGLYLVVHGVLGIFRQAAHARQAAQFPNQPWHSDYHWRAEGFAFSAFRAMLSRLFAALMWSLFLVPFFWIGLTHHGMLRVFLVFATLFALLGLIFWYRWAQMLADLLHYGNSFLNYDQFPYFLGGTFRARLRAPQHVSDLDELTFTLRCVQEKYVTTNTGNSRETKVVCYELYKDSHSLTRDQITGLAGGDIPVEFPLPPDQRTTTLCYNPPTYWEIEARGSSHAVNYQAYFLIPVYKQP
jgi:hypothetical protein